jgi:hypothetical protein
MANAVEKANTIAITDIQAINGITDDNLQALNGLEFAGFTPTEGHTLIATATASSSSTLSFTSGINSTYDVYEFRFERMHPAAIGQFQFQVNAVGQSGYNEVMTTTLFMAMHDEQNAYTYLRNEVGQDQAQGTAYQDLATQTSTANDSSCAGVLTLFAPSSTTYVKQFLMTAQNAYNSGNLARSQNLFAAGYINTTAAINNVSFKFSSGNIDAGQIKMYGIAKA